MRFPIPQYNPPTENFRFWEGGFTNEELDRIIEIAERFDFRPGEIGGGEVNEEVRDSKITWIHLEQETHWLHERLALIASKINHYHFGYDLDTVDGIQYTKYNADKKQHYRWHTDNYIGREGEQRKLSMTLMLTAPEDYEGGEFLLNTNGNQDNAESFKPKRGDIIFFHSHLPHQVSPVTAGERVSLVTWFLGPRTR
jgi:PKHD-type hydroxylase